MESDGNKTEKAPDRKRVEGHRVSEEHHRFTALVERTKKRVYSRIRRLISNGATAEELVQETYLRAWRGRSTFDQKSNEAAWILSIARNTVYDHLRELKAAKRDRPASLDRVLTERGERDGTSLVPAISQRLKPVDRLIVFEAIEELEQNEREMLDLQQAGYSYAEIGAAMGKSETAIGPALTRIRKKLAHALRDYEEDFKKRA